MMLETRAKFISEEKFISFLKRNREKFKYIFGSYILEKIITEYKYGFTYLLPS